MTRQDKLQRMHDIMEIYEAEHGLLTDEHIAELSGLRGEGNLSIAVEDDDGVDIYICCDNHNACESPDGYGIEYTIYRADVAGIRQVDGGMYYGYLSAKAMLDDIAPIGSHTDVYLIDSFDKLDEEFDHIAYIHSKTGDDFCSLYEMHVYLDENCKHTEWCMIKD